jgi:hypothetical protein
LSRESQAWWETGATAAGAAQIRVTRESGSATLLQFSVPIMIPGTPARVHQHALYEHVQPYKYWYLYEDGHKYLCEHGYQYNSDSQNTSTV